MPQHQQIVDWLGTLPFVDTQRIAFYGLSYGGKTAMRVPALVKNYCLSICSADFNEWVWKNASIGNRYSYMGTGEYEIFEFDLGSTFNYAEMAALIAPRPFMVERGHFDGVAPDEPVAYEYAKVRFLYEAKLGIGDRCRDRVVRRPAHDPRRGHVRVPQEAVVPAAAIRSATEPQKCGERRTLKVNKGDATEGNAKCRMTNGAHPQYADAHFHRGATYGDKGEHDKAIADFTEAVRLDEGRVEVGGQIVGADRPL